MTRKLCIVTGSSSGIGAATVERFARGGFDIVINYSRDEAPAQAVAKECREHGVEVLVEKADVSRDEDCRRLADVVGRKWGSATVLVNNAGRTKFVSLKDFEGISAQDFHDIYALNTIAPFQMVRAFAPLLRKAPGASVVNVSSIAGQLGLGSSIGYIASKGALNAMTVALARALGPEIRVNGVAPGMIEGEWLRKGLGDTVYDASKKGYSAQAALDSIIDPEDVAETIFFLATSAPKTSGEVLLVDAGYKIGRA